MIDFRRVCPQWGNALRPFLEQRSHHGCEYSLVNLYLWGRQEAAFLGESLLLFSQFGRNSVYPFPVIAGDPKPVLDAIIQDAAQRGIRCRISSMGEDDCRLLESLYPGRFQFYHDRDSYDYLYRIEDLAELAGRKYQKKRNHINRFRTNHINAQTLPLNEKTIDLAKKLVDIWFEQYTAWDPEGDNHLERIALCRAFSHYEELGMEGLVLVEDGEPLAMAMGSPLSADTFDIHFEKAREDADGAYAVINQAFARYLREKYPYLRYLNREDDLGLEGLRKAKLSYYPDHLVEKHWARLLEDDDED